MNKAELLQFCILYTGKEESVLDNPIIKVEDEFKWHMWRVEFVALHEALSCKTLDQAQEYIKYYIRDMIDVFADAPFGGDPCPYYHKYFGYRQN